MKSELIRLTYEIELQPGEPLCLPEELVARIGPGRWRLTVEPLQSPSVGNHVALLNSYAPEDEGLYDT